MGQTIGGWANVAGSMSRVESNSSSMGLGASLANEMRGWVSMGEAVCGGANIAGGVSRVECDTKTEAMRLSQGSGKEGGGENKELHVASAFLPTAGVKPESCSPM